MGWVGMKDPFSPGDPFFCISFKEREMLFLRMKHHTVGTAAENDIMIKETSVGGAWVA